MLNILCVIASYMIRHGMNDIFSHIDGSTDKIGA